MKDMVLSIMLSGAGATFLLFIITKFVPNDKLDGLFFKFGTLVDSYGKGKLGTVFWEKVEDWMEDTFEVCWFAFKRGLNINNGKEK